MVAPRHNRAVVAAMLLAALACYANAPRLASTLLIGDATNFVSVLHAGSHARLNLRLAGLPENSPRSAALQQRLADGSQSVAVIEALPPLPGALAADWLRARFDARRLCRPAPNPRPCRCRWWPLPPAAFTVPASPRHPGRVGWQITLTCPRARPAARWRAGPRPGCSPPVCFQFLPLSIPDARDVACRQHQGLFHVGFHQTLAPRHPVAAGHLPGGAQAGS